ncbi:hypothetical protein WN51_10207 [Melipona quadrifasciata]|uniref:Uncharacterized protein n=1 Tax=Melipona quadrifasciata TaxID=166423 RepID=A0A0M9A4L4_9HYME|nr:hypothetical protein WN51_10207 [Melipona quadrifasciata]
MFSQNFQYRNCMFYRETILWFHCPPCSGIDEIFYKMESSTMIKKEQHLARILSNQLQFPNLEFSVLVLKI